MLKKIISFIIVSIFSLAPVQAIHAQADALPIYIVQPGENLTEIAQKFNVSLQELINANNILDVNIISAGNQLFIPGLEGVEGVLRTEPVDFGDQLIPLLRRNTLSVANFMKLNPVTSPAELFVGSTLVLPEMEASQVEKSNNVLDSTSSIFVTSILNGLNPWVIPLENNLTPSKSLSGDVVYFNSQAENTTVSPFSNQITEISVRPLPFSQGRTFVVYIYAKSPANFSGSFGSKSLNFFADTEKGYSSALGGISAIAEAGLWPLAISGQFENGEDFKVEQNVLITPGGYSDESLSVEQTTVEKSIVESENLQIQQILEPISPDRLWTGFFRFPVDGSLEDGSIAFSSYFGSRRSYNNGQFTGYHGGLDFRVVLMSLNIYAAAPGRVIFAGEMNIRGNTVFIDHGQGVVSGYAHMQEFKVKAGDFVDQGQIIGIIGKTGRVTGPHLHWDIWVNGTQVNPLDWVNNSYP